MESLIHQRRRQVLVHSILYYRMDQPILSDERFDFLAKDLSRLQKEHPEASMRVMYHHKEFQDFNGETGFHLPLGDIRATNVARHLLAYDKKLKAEKAEDELWTISPELPSSKVKPLMPEMMDNSYVVRVTDPHVLSRARLFNANLVAIDQAFSGNKIELENREQDS